MAKKKTDIAQFEQSLLELEQIVERMENGEQSLEQALQDFEKGVQLTRICQQALQQAEQSVEILMSKSADSDTSPFDPEASA